MGADPELPWSPPAWEMADAYALQALQRGEAEPEQQRRALKFIGEKLCGLYDLEFRPGSTSRATDFAGGKRFVGLQLVKLLNVDLAKMRQEKHE